LADVIKVNVPTFLRILELSREDVKDDADLHDIAEIMVELSKSKVVSMEDYPKILQYMKSQKADPDKKLLDSIKKLSGLK